MEDTSHPSIIKHSIHSSNGGIDVTLNSSRFCKIQSYWLLEISFKLLKLSIFFKTIHLAVLHAWNSSSETCHRIGISDLLHCFFGLHLIFSIWNFDVSLSINSFPSIFIVTYRVWGNIVPRSIVFTYRWSFFFWFLVVMVSLESFRGCS